MQIQKQFDKQNSLDNQKKLNGDGNARDEGNDQSMFILTISQKIKEIKSKFAQGSVTVL